MLDTFGALVGRSFQCALVFNDASPNWAGWEMPWFITKTHSDMAWGKWASAPGTHRKLIITQNLFPASENHANWLQLGASGAFERHARALAANLVKAGLGSAVIRLAHEANGTWYPDSIPNTPAGDRLWIEFWRKTALAMRSVPGAHFMFDWTINEYYRDVPLKSFYPGDDVVDIIGIDAYDAGIHPHTNRWSTLYNLPDGIATVSAFAASHGKPMSIPEWGIAPAVKPQWGAAGDDPAYVSGIAWVVAHTNVAYQTYFDADEVGMQFFNSPLSIAAYRRDFGAHGIAVAASLRVTQTLPRSPAPPLRITRGPKNEGTVTGNKVTFTFWTKGGQVDCSVDGSWHACSGAGRDSIGELSPGYHYWNVEVTDANNDVSILGRAFLVGRSHGAASPLRPK